MRQFLLLCLSLLLSCRQAPPSTNIDNIAPRGDYAEVAAKLQAFIEHELQDKGLPALSIALVDDQATVWAQGFGFADAGQQQPATAATVYRVGSVSKLFTDIAIMQLVEQGVLDLDTPVMNYLADFRPHNPFATPITLRQLLSHRAGLVREPPVGHYFDPSSPSLAETVASLNETTLVYPPGTRTKYSNAGIAVAGYVLEQMQGQPFAGFLQEAVLQPLGLRHSSFTPDASVLEHLAAATMWGYDGRTFAAPTFELGMAPAGSMYSTVLDQGRFLSVLCRKGQGILQPESLEAMWTPQFGDNYGIGFRLSELDGRRQAGHGGAIYGFATQLSLLPDEQLGVVVTAALYGANDVVERIADYALRLMVAQREKAPLLTLSLPAPLDSALARRLDGTYRHGEEEITLVERNGRLQCWQGGLRAEVKALGDTLVTDGRLTSRMHLLPIDNNSLLVNGQRYQKVSIPEPPPPPDRWRGLIGEYGWDHNILFLLEKDQQLYALIEWFFLYPLTEMTADTFAFPDYGLYHGEQIVFRRNNTGQATAAIAAGISFERRPVGLEEGATFRIETAFPIDTLRRRALAATPPEAPAGTLPPDLVELITLEPSIHLDIRYATTNNFMSEVFYQQARAFMQRPAAEALVNAHRQLREKGFGILIHDAYRPWYVTKMFFDATPADKKIFVADPARGSIHNRGAAVDLTLYDLKTGQPEVLVSGYDEFSERAFPDYPGGTAHQRWLRELLRDIMEENGFEVYHSEWWHFNFRDALKYPVLNLRFEEL